MKILMSLALAIPLLTGCATYSNTNLSKTLGEKSSGFTYIPLDPIPIVQDVNETGSCIGYSAIDLASAPVVLGSLPDNDIRVSVREVIAGGSASYGPVSTAIKGNRYRVVLDYINKDSTNIKFNIKKNPAGDYYVRRLNSGEFNRDLNKSQLIGDNIFSIPVYVGIGLRITAELGNVEGKLNLSGLGVIAAGVESKAASGSLTVQTLGLNGKQVSTSLPLPSELNQSTVQQAILALGSIKAIMYEGETNVTPRVTGLYLPYPDGDEKLVNLIISELAKAPIVWNRYCRPR